MPLSGTCSLKKWMSYSDCAAAIRGTVASARLDAQSHTFLENTGIRPRLCDDPRLFWAKEITRSQLRRSGGAGSVVEPSRGSLVQAKTRSKGLPMNSVAVLSYYLARFPARADRAARR